MATHSSVLAWRIPGVGEPGLAVYGVTQSRTRLKRLSSSSNISSVTFCYLVMYCSISMSLCFLLFFVLFCFVLFCFFCSWYLVSWRRERLLTPVFWPGKFHGLQSMGLQRVGHYRVTFTHRVVIREDTWYSFNSLKFTEVWYVAQDVVYPGKCSIWTWE